MLQMRPNCECCDKDLPPEAPGAMICSFECTFCTECATGVLKNTCPNCGGGFAARPTRALDKLAKYPAAKARVLKQGGCKQAA